MAAPVAQGPPPPQDGPRAVFGRKEAACCLTQSGSSSPWKQLSEPRDAAAVLEPVVRAPLLPSGGSRSPGPPKRLKPFLGARKPFLELFSSTVTALQASLDYQSQPTTGKSPKKSPEESSYRRNHGRVIVSVIAKSMTKSKDTASLELSGSIQSCSIILSLYSGVGCSSGAARPTEHPPEPQKTARASPV